MVALALLCGSDYNGSGIEGVGFTNAINFLKTCSDKTVLPKYIHISILYLNWYPLFIVIIFNFYYYPRLSSWVSEPHAYDDISKSIENSNLCSGCGHCGNIRSHNRYGCNYCKTSIGCSVTDYKYKYYIFKFY